MTTTTVSKEYKKENILSSTLGRFENPVEEFVSFLVRVKDITGRHVPYPHR